MRVIPAKSCILALRQPCSTCHPGCRQFWQRRPFGSDRILAAVAKCDGGSGGGCGQPHSHKPPSHKPPTAAYFCQPMFTGSMLSKPAGPQFARPAFTA